MKMYCRTTDGKLISIKKIMIGQKCFTPDDIQEISNNGTTITLKDGTVYRIGSDLDLGYRIDSDLDLGLLQRSK